MISMAYDLSKISMTALMRPAFDAGIALTRLDERIARSAVGEGWIERSQFTDACASLWIDGELVHLEDLVLHDATKDIRTPTHELTIARDVLRTRRRIAAQLPGWALSSDGSRRLRRKCPRRRLRRHRCCARPIGRRNRECNTARPCCRKRSAGL
jgi:hypothetical protein